MTPAAAYMLLLAAAAITAAVVAHRRPEHRPVAVYLDAVLALDLLRLGLAQLLPAGQGPYEGWAEVVRGVDQGAYVALCAALPVVLGVGVFLRGVRR
jgi:hypothetical protein